MPIRVAAGMRRHAAEVTPGECCGALMGRAHGRAWTVQTMIPLQNEATEANRYSIGAPTVLRLERQATRSGLELIGFYHSHPSGDARPSATDLELACPGYVYIVVARHGPVRAWRLKPDRTGFAELTTRLAGAT
jgi:proteasome lid subunit RPN8/RPN11